MAHVAISVKNGLYTISTDSNDWTGLTVNGQQIGGGSGPFNWTQETAGPVDFTLNMDIGTVSVPSNLFILKGTSDTHLAALTYAINGGGLEIQGLLDNVSPRPGAQQGPVFFSGGNMTGSFDVH